MFVNSIKVFLAVGPTDLRKSVDGLAVIVQKCFKLDPFSQALYVFCNRRKDKIKILVWDHDGFWLHYKQLEKSTFKWPDGKTSAMQVDSRAFRWLLDGLSLYQSQARKSVNERVII